MRLTVPSLTLLIAQGCSGPAAELPAPSQASTASDAMQQTLREYAEAWDAHDARKAASYFTEDGVVTVAGGPDAVGRAAIEATIAANLGAASDGRVPFTRLFAQGDVIIGEWVWVGTHSGDLMGLPATNEAFGLRGVSVYTFSPDAKLKAAHAYLDPATLMSQLGVSPAEARPIEAGPSADATTVAATGGAEEQRNIESATAMMAAFEKKSAEDFTSSASPAVIWDDMSKPASEHGLDAAKQYFMTMTTAFPDAKVTTEGIWATGDYVIAETTFSGTQSGALGEIAPTNKPVAIHAVELLEYDADGMLVHRWSYGNSTEMAMQLGLMPPPEGGQAP